MTIYVISRLCRDCVDGACIEVCPVSDCIVEHRPKDRPSELPNQLFINPDQCIGCAACEPACPWEAIFDADDIPEAFKPDVGLNAVTVRMADEFVQAEPSTSSRPSAKEVEANKEKWREPAKAAVS